MQLSANSNQYEYANEEISGWTLVIRIKEINLYPGTKSAIQSDKIYSGDFLMKIGFNPEINSGRLSVLLEINEVK